MFQLPNPQQVKNVAGHLATGAATAIAILGLQAKGFDSVKITAAINAMGDLVNNLLIVASAVGGAYAAWKSVSGSSTNEVTRQSAQAIMSNPAAVAAALPAETKAELAQATVAVAANSATANKALLENVVSLGNVQGIVVDKNTALSTPNPLVTANPADIPKAA